MTADTQTRTITVDDSVKVTKAGTDASLADLKVGDQVRLHQTRATDGTYTVTGIDIVLSVRVRRGHREDERLDHDQAPRWDVDHDPRRIGHDLSVAASTTQTWP